MSQNNLIKFCQLARTDHDLTQRLQSLSSTTTHLAIDEMIGIANDQGLPFSRDDYFDYLLSIQLNKLNA